MSIIEVPFKSIKKSIFFFFKNTGCVFMGFIVLEGPDTLSEFHFRGVDCLQMLSMGQQKKVFRSTFKKFLKV